VYVPLGSDGANNRQDAPVDVFMWYTISCVSTFTIVASKCAIVLLPFWFLGKFSALIVAVKLSPWQILDGALLMVNDSTRNNDTSSTVLQSLPEYPKLHSQ